MGQKEGQWEERKPSDIEYAPDSPYKAARDAAISQQHPVIMPIDLRSGNNYSAADDSASVTSDGGTPPILSDRGRLLYEAARDVSSADDTEGDDTEDEDEAIAPPCDSHRRDSVENGDTRDEKGTGSLGEATRRHPAGSSVERFPTPVGVFRPDWQGEVAPRYVVQSHMWPMPGELWSWQGFLVGTM